MKKINKTLFKSLALALGVCSLVPLTACGRDKSKVQVWDAEKAYATAASQGFTGTYEEFLQQMSGIKSINIDSNGHLVFVLGDDSVVDAGVVTGRKGQDGKGIKEVTTAYDHVQKKTVVTITFTDDTQQSFDILDASQGEQGEKGEKGDTGVGIADITEGRTDRWKIVHELVYTMTDGTSRTFDVGFGVVYGRSYDVQNYDELKYVLDHGVKDIILTRDITIPTSKGRLFLSAQNNEDTYYKFDLNGHTLNGALWIDATDANSKDLTYGAYADVMNGKINSAELDNPVLDYGLVVYGSHTGVNLTNMEVYGYKAGLSTNGLYNGVEIVAEDCKFYGTGNGYAKALLDNEIQAQDKAKKASLGAFLPAYGNYDFTHCWFEGELGVNAKSGEITFENCHIEGTSEYTAPKYNNNGSSGAGSALVATSTIGYHRPMNITIKESELISHHGYALEEVKLGPVAGEEVCYTTITIKNSDLQSTTDVEDENAKFNMFYTQNNVVSCYDDGGSVNDYIQAGASTIYIIDEKGNVYQTIDVARSSAELANLVETDKEMIYADLSNGENSHAIPATILAKYKVEVLEDDFAVLSRVGAINMQKLSEGQYEGQTNDLKLDLDSGNATQAFVITNPTEGKINLSIRESANPYFEMKLKKQVVTTEEIDGVKVVTGVEFEEVTNAESISLEVNESATFFYALTLTEDGENMQKQYQNDNDMEGYMNFMLNLRFGFAVDATVVGE